MVNNNWNESDASKFTSPLALRAYSSRLLGSDERLVLHGGGNTSIKDQIKDVFGEKINALFIKGSGHNLGTIGEDGFSPMRLDALLKLKKINALSDKQMLNYARTNLLDYTAPDPSVEWLLHAFLPHKVVDHTHADAVLTLTNRPDSESTISELYGNKIAVVPYIMPGFSLAKTTFDIFTKNPDIEGMVLLRHGIFTFGDTIKESYDRMIQFVQQAEEYVLSKTKVKISTSVTCSQINKANWMQAVRKELLARELDAVLTADSSSEALFFVGQPNAEKLSQIGPLTVDHVTRTKSLPLFAKEITDLPPAFDKYIESYKDYFEKYCLEKHIERKMLDPLPRVFVVPGVGIISAGETFKAANIAKDIYHQTLQAIIRAEEMGGYEPASEDHMFDVEYWELQQNKLKLSPKKAPLTGKTAVVTGGASGIGLAITREYLEQGACVSVLDINEKAFTKLLEELTPKQGNSVIFLKTDVSDRKAVAQSLIETISTFGGIDILIVNAGIFPNSALLEDIEERDWQRSLDVNLTGSLHVVAESIKWMKKQEHGGDIVFVASKNVLAPGPKAGAYSIAKAAQTQLARLAALEAGGAGIRVNMLHPHLIFDTGIWTDEVIASRAKAYNMTPEEYKTNNLLKTGLCSKDVAKAAFALSAGYFSKTTGAQIPVDGGSNRTL